VAVIDALVWGIVAGVVLVVLRRLARRRARGAVVAPDVDYGSALAPSRRRDPSGEHETWTGLR